VIRQSFAWWSFANDCDDLAGLASSAVSIGFEGVELAPLELEPMLRDVGLAIVARSAHAIDAGFADRTLHRRLTDEVSGQIEQASSDGVPTLIVFAGRQDGRSDEEGIDATSTALAPLGEVAERAGVTLLLEVLNRHDHPDHQCDRAGWAAEVVRRGHTPGLRMLFDVYHVQMGEGNVIARFREHHASVGHVHTAGVPGRRDLDSDQELNYPAIFRAIAATGYDRWIGHELTPKADPVACLASTFELARTALESDASDTDPI
jgi:hydroxypyruvate isomerase